MSYYFWKSINKWWNGGDLKLALWAMGKTEKRGITLQCLAARKGFSRCASNFACNVHIDTRWCTRYFNVLGPFLDTERDYLLEGLRIFQIFDLMQNFENRLCFGPQPSFKETLRNDYCKQVKMGWLCRLTKNLIYR